MGQDGAGLNESAERPGRRRDETLSNINLRFVQGPAAPGRDSSSPGHPECDSSARGCIVRLSLPSCTPKPAVSSSSSSSPAGPLIPGCLAARPPHTVLLPLGELAAGGRGHSLSRPGASEVEGAAHCNGCIFLRNFRNAPLQTSTWECTHVFIFKQGTGFASSWVVGTGMQWFDRFGVFFACSVYS